MAIYYVRPTNGDDGANDGLSFANAFQTTQKAADTATAGDEVRLCNEATETPSAAIDFDTNSGTTDSEIVFVGADSSGNPLTTGYYTISGASLPATTNLIQFNGTVGQIRFSRIRFTAATNRNIDNCNFTKFVNCRLDNAGSDAVGVDDQTANVFVGCEIDNNAGEGYRVDNANRGDACCFIGCSFHHNSIGINASNGAFWIISECLIFENTSHGINIDLYFDYGAVIENTIYDNGGDGIFINRNPGAPFRIIGNSIALNGRYGINFDDGDTHAGNTLIDYNHTYNNVSGPSNLTLPGDNNVTGDPLFADAANGDFTPGSSSPLVGVGPNGQTIGAVEPDVNGGFVQSSSGRFGVVES
jgi:hypothetical protein